MAYKRDEESEKGDIIENGLEKDRTSEETNGEKGEIKRQSEKTRCSERKLQRKKRENKEWSEYAFTLCVRPCVRVTERTTKAKHRHDRTQGTTHDANGDEIHHGTGDVLLMVTVGDPGWAGCTMRSDVGLAFDLFFVFFFLFFFVFVVRLSDLSFSLSLFL